MFYTNLHNSKPEVFKRLTGVSRETFALMISVLKDNLPDWGRPPT